MAVYYLWMTVFAFWDTKLVFGQANTPIITIPDGNLKGATKSTIKNNITYYEYRGIPFAKKPTGDLRFAARITPPVKNSPWKGTLDATKDKDPCTQMGGTLATVGIVGSEDCLYINVYTTNVNGKLPVMIWMYGGGFIIGSSKFSMSGPDYFLENGVIFVSFNYRLGIFGFLSTEDLSAPGNWGLKDQVLALNWVKNNIKYFGGDPTKVTIFGGSAGSASVSYLVQNKLTEGLYRGAIMQSGTTLCFWALTRNARQTAFKVGSKLGIVAINSSSLINDLRKVDYKTLKLAENNYTIQTLLTESILAGLPFGVVQEPYHPQAAFSGKSWQKLYTGNFQKVPMIIGFTSDEAAGIEYFQSLVDTPLVELDTSRIAPYDLSPNWLKRLNAGTEIRSKYFGVEPIPSQLSALRIFASMNLFNRAIRETVNQASKYTNIYYYQFSYEGLLGNPNRTYPGAAHSEESSYLFPRNTNQTVNAQDAQMIQKLVTLWTNFAKTGYPTFPGQNPILGNVTWLPNNSTGDPKSIVKYLNINQTLAMESNPFQPDWLFYKYIYDKYGDPPYTTY